MGVGGKSSGLGVGGAVVLGCLQPDGPVCGRQCWARVLPGGWVLPGGSDASCAGSQHACH